MMAEQIELNGLSTTYDHPFQCLAPLQFRADGHLVMKLVVACGLRLFLVDVLTGVVSSHWEATQHDSKVCNATGCPLLSWHKHCIL